MKPLRVMKQSFVICPMCGKGKIIIEDEDSEDAPLQLILPNSKRKARWYIKCNVCKNQIGIAAKTETQYRSARFCGTYL